MYLSILWMMVWWHLYVDPEIAVLEISIAHRIIISNKFPSRIAPNHSYNDDVRLNRDGRWNHLHTNFIRVLWWHCVKVKGDTAYEFKNIFCNQNLHNFTNLPNVSTVVGYVLCARISCWSFAELFFRDFLCQNPFRQLYIATIESNFQKFIPFFLKWQWPSKGICKELRHMAGRFYCGEKYL